jgi:hypothetical protein
LDRVRERLDLSLQTASEKPVLGSGMSGRPAHQIDDAILPRRRPWVERWRRDGRDDLRRRGIHAQELHRSIAARSIARRLRSDSTPAGRGAVHAVDPIRADT